MLCKHGRTPYLTDENMENIRGWLRTRCNAENYPTLREVKERIWIELESLEHPPVPSRNYFFKVIDRLMGKEFVQRSASPMEPKRYELGYDTVSEYFDVLEGVELDSVRPELVINIDEIGFGQSQSGRARSKVVICLRGVKGQVSYRERNEKHFVAAIGAITASGRALDAGLIVKRTYAHPDMLKMPFWQRHRVYSSPKAFISKKIFGDYLRTVVVPYIESTRKNRRWDDERAVLIMDGHKSHLVTKIKEILATRNISLIFIPPHSSHVLQPLDQGYFKRVKQGFVQRKELNGCSSISSTLQRISCAFQSASTDWDIMQSWSHAGIVIEYEAFGKRVITLDREKVLETEEVRHISINESATGQKINESVWGLLNEDDQMLREAGLCPVCCAPLASVDVEWDDS